MGAGGGGKEERGGGIEEKSGRGDKGVEGRSLQERDRLFGFMKGAG